MKRKFDDVPRRVCISTPRSLEIEFSETSDHRPSVDLLSYKYPKPIVQGSAALFSDSFVSLLGSWSSNRTTESDFMIALQR